MSATTAKTKQVKDTLKALVAGGALDIQIAKQQIVKLTKWKDAGHAVDAMVDLGQIMVVKGKIVSVS